MLDSVLKIVVANVIPCTINSFVVMYLLSKILDRKLDFKNYKIYLSITFLVTVALLNFFFVNDLIRIVISTCSVIAVNYYIFHETVNKTIASSIIEQLILTISEIIFVIVLIIIFSNDSQILMSTFYGKFITIVFISIIACFIVNIKKVTNFLRKIINGLDKINQLYVTAMLIAFIIIINILLFSVFHEVNLLAILLLNLFFMCVYAFIVYRGLMDKSNIIRIEAENKFLADNLGEYEKALDSQRVSSHESKNQLLVIKSMMMGENSKALDYINEVINDQKKDNEYLFEQTKKIPIDGLQGIIYQKMLVMNEYSIKFLLNVDKKADRDSFNNINSKLNYDICRIIGVFLDNAIDEVGKLDKKEITVSIYDQDNYLMIEVANPFDSIPNLDKIDEMGFTTKGKGHGYGLSLVKSIIESSDLLDNERSVIRNIFVQVLKVKINN